MSRTTLGSSARSDRSSTPHPSSQGGAGRGESVRSARVGLRRRSHRPMTPAAEGTRPPDEYADRDTARRGGQDDERQRRLELPEEEGDRYRLPVLESPNCHEHSDHREHDQEQHGKHLSGARQSPAAKTLHDDGRCVGPLYLPLYLLRSSAHGRDRYWAFVQYPPRSRRRCPRAEDPASVLSGLRRARRVGPRHAPDRSGRRSHVVVRGLAGRAIERLQFWRARSRCVAASHGARHAGSRRRLAAHLLWVNLMSARGLLGMRVGRDPS